MAFSSTSTGPAGHLYLSDTQDMAVPLERDFQLILLHLVRVGLRLTIMVRFNKITNNIGFNEGYG